MVQIIKNTSLASVVGFVELARSGQIINNSLFEPFLVYAIIAVDLFRPLLSGLARSAVGSRRASGPARSNRDRLTCARPHPNTSSPSSSAFKDVHKSFGALKVLDGVNFEVDRGEVLGHHRPQRLGQEHRASLHRPLRDDRQRRDRRLRPPRQRPEARSAGAAPGCRHRVPELQPVSPPDDRGEHHARALLGKARREDAGEGAGAARSLPRSGWRTSFINIPSSFPAASSSARRSPARSPCSQR